MTTGIYLAGISADEVIDAVVSAMAGPPSVQATEFGVYRGTGDGNAVFGSLSETADVPA